MAEDTAPKLVMAAALLGPLAQCDARRATPAPPPDARPEGGAA